MEKPTPPKNYKEKPFNFRPLIIFLFFTGMLWLQYLSTFEYIFLMWLFIVLPNTKFKIKFKK